MHKFLSLNTETWYFPFPKLTLDERMDENSLIRIVSKFTKFVKIVDTPSEWETV